MTSPGEDVLAGLLAMVETAALSADAKTAALTYCNAAATRLLGPDAVGAPARGFLMSRVHEADRDLFAAFVRDMETRGRADRELRFLSPEGVVRPVRLVARAAHDAAGEVVRYDAVAIDVGERRRFEEEHATAEARLRRILDAGWDAYTITDGEGRRVLVGGQVGRVFGYTVEEYAALPFGGAVVPEERTLVSAQIAASLAAPEERITARHRVRRRDGVERILETSIVNLLHDPAVRGIVTSGHDVTERVTAERALLSSERRFRRVLDASSDLVTLHDDAGSLVFVNEAVTRLLGFEPDAYLALPLDARLAPEELPRLEPRRRRAREAGDAGVVDVVGHRHADGSVRALEVRAIDLTDEPSVGAVVEHARPPEGTRER
jgi:PAS domain S-box-containing protein